MKYYSERNGLLKIDFSIRLDELIQYFEQTYRYFNNKGYFDRAMKGIWTKEPYQDEEQVLPPSFAPSPEIFFVNHLQSNQVYPIFEYCEYYSEETLFTVIEILYDHIATYDYKRDVLNEDEPRQEFSEHINNILRLYKNGYYLEPKNGFVSELPNDALKALLQQEIPVAMDMTVIDQLITAIKLYYRFDANMETKKKAINILADILEPLREELKNILNQEFEINKNEHDKMIFGIVNAFNIRHNKTDQLRDYSKDIWYDWMMQYYSSVIITFYKLKTALPEPKTYNR